MKQTIFVVEDDQDISRLTALHLDRAGYNVKTYSSAAKVMSDAAERAPALFLLDVMLPGTSGTELCRRIRESTQLAKVPIIFVTAKSAEQDKIAGLDLGADDYITKPFSPREMVARVRSVLRRFEATLAPQSLHFGELEIDTEGMLLKKGGEVVGTTATEFRLLAYLAQHPKRVFTRDQLLDAVWRDTAFVTPRSVDVYVRRLREKIEPDPEEPRYIVTVRGAGYRFES